MSLRIVIDVNEDIKHNDDIGRTLSKNNNLLYLLVFLLLAPLTNRQVEVFRGFAGAVHNDSRVTVVGI